MASTDALIAPIKNSAFRMPVGPFFKTDGTIITTWTSMDSEISEDGANFTDCTNEATEIQTSGVGFLDLTAGETNCDSFWIKTTISNTDAVPFVAYYATQRAGAYLRSNVSEINAVSTSAVTTIKAVQGLAVDGVITTATNLTTNNDKTGYGLSSAAVQAIWDALTSALTTVGSIGKKLADWVIGTAQTGDSFARLGAPAGASVSADIAAVKVDTGALTHADGVEAGISLLQSQRALLATAVGPATGGNTSTIPFKNPGDTATRVTLNGLDANGNRTAPTLNL